MLPVLKTDEVIAFDSATSALAYLGNRTVQRFTVPVSEITIDEQGCVSYTGHSETVPLRRVPMTDVALQHFNRLFGVPQAYADRLEYDMHARALNDHGDRCASAVTVVVEAPKSDSDDRRIAAVVPGGRLGLDDAVILEAVAEKDVPSHVRLRNGVLEVRVGDPIPVEVLPEDTMTIAGFLRNERWGVARPASRKALEVSLFIERLVCANGLYAERQVAGAQLAAWATKRELAAFVHNQIERVLSFHEAGLRPAIERMANEIAPDDVALRIAGVIERAIGRERANELTATAVSLYDFLNAVTGAAHHASSESRRRFLQLEGGELLEQHLRVR